MHSVGKEIWSYVKIFLFAIIFAYLINHFLFAPYVVKGQSMHPNLQSPRRSGCRESRGRCGEG